MGALVEVAQCQAGGNKGLPRDGILADRTRRPANGPNSPRNIHGQGGVAASF